MGDRNDDNFHWVLMVDLSNHWFFREDDSGEFTRQKGESEGGNWRRGELEQQCALLAALKLDKLKQSYNLRIHNKEFVNLPSKFKF